MVVFMQYGVGGRDTYFPLRHAEITKCFSVSFHNIFDAFIVDSWVADMEFGDVGFGIMFSLSSARFLSPNTFSVG